MFRSLKLTLSSPTKAFVFTANQDGPIKVGRSLKCQFSIPLEDLSREHCQIEVQGEEIFITDLGSSNGVWINRDRLDPLRPCLINVDSHIVLAKLYKLKLERVEFNTSSDIVNHHIEREGKSDSFKKMLSSAETNTVSFELDYPVNKDKRHKKKSDTKAQAKTPMEKNNDVIKMVFGFLVALGFVAYYMTK
jgi:pSer/pThr/pTyr-binding forkhead associated (FHA) protein